MHVGSDGGRQPLSREHGAPHALFPEVGKRHVVRCSHVQPDGIQTARVKAAQTEADHREHVPRKGKVNNFYMLCIDILVATVNLLMCRCNNNNNNNMMKKKKDFLYGASS